MSTGAAAFAAGGGPPGPAPRCWASSGARKRQAAPIATSERLTDIPRPFPGRLLVRRGPPHLANEYLPVERIPRRRAFDDQVVAHFEREARDPTLRELRNAAPLTAPAHFLAVLLGHFDVDERMGIANIELDHVPFDLHHLMLDVGAGERVMRIDACAGDDYRGGDDGKNSDLHSMSLYLRVLRLR